MPFRDRVSTTTPATASDTAAQTRAPSRSRSTAQDSSATTAGSVARMTPAAAAEVSATPDSIRIENRKLPNSDCTNSVPISERFSGASPGRLRSQGSIATAPMPKRSQASRKTGSAAVSGLLSAT